MKWNISNEVPPCFQCVSVEFHTVSNTLITNVPWVSSAIWNLSTFSHDFCATSSIFTDVLHHPSLLSLEPAYFSCSFSNFGWWGLSFSTSMDCILYQLYTVTTFSSVRDFLHSWEMHQRTIHNLYRNIFMHKKYKKIIEKISILKKVRGVRLSRGIFVLKRIQLLVACQLK